MIRRLRMKFTLAALLAMVVVLLVTLGIVNGMNYRRVVQEADRVLDVLLENDGTFPQPPRFVEGGRPGMGEWGEHGMSPETPYESRFFTISYDGEGNVLQANVDRIAEVDAKTAREYGEEVCERTGNRGFVGTYRYLREREADGSQYMIFLHCGRNLSQFWGFLLISIITSAVGIVVVFVLLLFLSGRVIRPFAESYRKQKRFITDAGHEIRTPLTIIDADAEILEMESGENEWIQDIHRQIERLRILTDDLIYLSRMEEEEKAMNKMTFPLSEVAHDAVHSFQSLAILQKKDFRWEIEPLLSYDGDMQALQRLFSILLDNALKYSGEGGTITFSLRRKNRTISLQVVNMTKEPVTSEQTSHFFERFYRTDTSRNSQTGGYGIGLSIARAIVVAHKGKISASTTDGQSLAIQVTLPGAY